jgi:hydrogenase nickel incorporation protein HypA/HybF
MHELSLCRSISGIVVKAAGQRKVSVVDLDIGQLRQVVPGTLEYCWGLLSQGTPLEGSQLRIHHIPAVLACRDCGVSTQLATVPILKCEACSSTAVDIESGEEFMVTSVEVEG